MHSWGPGAPGTAPGVPAKPCMPPLEHRLGLLSEARDPGVTALLLPVLRVAPGCCENVPGNGGCWPTQQPPPGSVPSAYGTLTVRSLLDTREHCLNEFNFPDPYSKVSATLWGGACVQGDMGRKPGASCLVW